MKPITQEMIKQLIETYLSHIPSKYNYDAFDNRLKELMKNN